MRDFNYECPACGGKIIHRRFSSGCWFFCKVKGNHMHNQCGTLVGCGHSWVSLTWSMTSAL